MLMARGLLGLVVRDFVRTTLDLGIQFMCKTMVLAYIQ